VRQPDDIFISNEFRSSVQLLQARLGQVDVRAPHRWQGFADRLDLGSSFEPGPSPQVDATVIVGPVAAVLKHARVETGEFGFVMPVAQRAKPWQRATPWSDDATLLLWRAGWSTVAVHRLLVPLPQAVMEFAIGNARPTPTTEPHDQR